MFPSRSVRSLDARRLAAAGLAGAILVAVVTIVAAAALNTRSAAGAGGGGCFGVTSPVCTFKDHVAFADFGSVSLDKCAFTDAFVNPFETLTTPGKVAATAVFVSVTKFNCLTNTFENATNIDPATGSPVFNGTVQFGTQLNTAAINGSAPMFDSSSGLQTFTSTINVAWQGVGPTSTFIDSAHFRSPGFLMNSHFMGTSRMAIASGVVTDETATNLATSPTLYADLQNDSGGTLFLSRS
jgi:hypothetical protein